MLQITPHPGLVIVLQYPSFMKQQILLAEAVMQYEYPPVPG
jgi:hypothetical protein